MFRIYQIGNYRVNLVPSSGQGVSFSAPTTFRRPSDELSGVSGEVLYSMPGRPIVKAGKVKVDGALICGANITCESVDQQFRRLIANGGDVVPIIGLIPAEDCVCTLCGGAGCPCCISAPEDMWLLSYGVVTEYKADYKQDYGQSFGSGELNVSMSIDGTTYWEPLNDVEWRFWGRNKPLYPDATGNIGKNVHPCVAQYYGRADQGFQKMIGLTPVMYDPANWVQAYSYVLNRRQRAVLPTDDPTLAVVTVTSVAPFVHYVNVPYINFPAQPRSMYYFSNLPTSGTITLTVSALTLHGYTVTNTATLDLAVVTALSGLDPDGILADDSIIIGLNENLKTIYLKFGTTLVDMFVPWEYNGLYPGETFLGDNTVTVEISAGSFDFSYAHIFRSC